MTFNSPEVQNTYNMTWAIENFCSITKQKGEFIESLQFYENKIYGPKWTLKVYPRGYDTDAYVSFSVNKVKGTATPDTVCFMVSIIAKDGSSQLTKEKSPEVFGSGSDGSCIISDFVERDAVINRKQFLLPNGTLTLRCVLKYPVKGNSVHSQIEIERLTFNWLIKNFSALEVCNNVMYPFPVRFNQAPELQLCFCLVGESVSEAQVHIECQKKTKFIQNYKNAYGRNPKENEYGCTTYYDIAISLLIAVSILDAKGNLFDVLQSEHLFTPSTKDEIFRFPSLMGRSDLIAKKNQFLPNDELNLHIQLQISNGAIESIYKEVEYIHLARQNLEFRPVHNNLGEALFNDKKFCDIDLKIGHNVFRAHKAVLCSQSPIFYNLIVADKNKGLLELDSMDMDTLKSLLSYVYTSKIDESLDYAGIKKLYAAAQEYQIQSLIEKCSSTVISKITAENVRDVSVLASSFGEFSMINSAKMFISEHLDDCLASDGWTKMIESIPKQSNQYSK